MRVGREGGGGPFGRRRTVLQDLEDAADPGGVILDRQLLCQAARENRFKMGTPRRAWSVPCARLSSVCCIVHVMKGGGGSPLDVEGGIFAFLVKLIAEPILRHGMTAAGSDRASGRVSKVHLHHQLPDQREREVCGLTMLTPGKCSAIVSGIVNT